MLELRTSTGCHPRTPSWFSVQCALAPNRRPPSEPPGPWSPEFRHIRWASRLGRAGRGGLSLAIRWFENPGCRRLLRLSGFWRDSPSAGLEDPFHHGGPGQDISSFGVRGGVIIEE